MKAASSRGISIPDEIKLLKYINKLGGLRFALEEDVVEWLETLKVARLKPTIRPLPHFRQAVRGMWLGIWGLGQPAS